MATEAKVQLKSSYDQISEVKQVKVRLKSSDNQIFEVKQVVAFESETVKQMIEDMGEESIVPLPNVRGNILAKVIEYCKFHVEAAKTSAISEEDVKKWDQAFVQVDVDTLINIVLAANYMNLNNLLDLTTQSVADIMKERTPEEVRTMFNIKNDFTPEEEEEIRHKYQWAFE